MFLYPEGKLCTKMIEAFEINGKKLMNQQNCLEIWSYLDKCRQLQICLNNPIIQAYQSVKRFYLFTENFVCYHNLNIIYKYTL